MHAPTCTPLCVPKRLAPPEEHVPLFMLEIQTSVFTYESRAMPRDDQNCLAPNKGPTRKIFFLGRAKRKNKIFWVHQ